MLQECGVLNKTEVKTKPYKQRDNLLGLDKEGSAGKLQMTFAHRSAIFHILVASNSVEKFIHFYQAAQTF